MKLPLARLFSTLAVLLFLGAPALIGAPEQRQTLQGSVKDLSAKETLAVDKLEPQHLAEQVEFQIALKMRDFAKLAQRTQNGETISRAELEALYLPLPEDYQTVLDWAQGEGLTVTGTDPMRMGIFLKGTVAQLQQALQTEFARVTVAEGTFTSALTAPSLPAKAARPVLGVNGLQPHVHPRHMSVQPQSLTDSNPPYLVKQIMTAYGANALPYTGAGEKIAILIDTYPKDSDLTSFWTNNNIPQTLSNIEKVQVVGGSLAPPEGEETLDVEWSSGIASQAKVRIYATVNLSFVNLDKGYQKIINDLPSQPQMHQLSISLGLGETYISTSQKQTDSQYFTTIASQGVSVFVSSGDSGANEGQMLQVSYFASDPSVTGVGGTSLRLNPAGAVLNESCWAGSGGGISAFFSRPSWQANSSFPLPVGTKRLVPDVSAVADPGTGAYIYLNGVAKQIGGTSWSSPAWAGFCALINQARKQNGRGSIGALNPKIYPLLGTANFRDVTSGSNGGYSATAGYDMVTGIGVPVMNVLVPTLAGGLSTGPALTSFSPTIGAVGTDVVLNGINLDKTIGVKFNGATAPFTILSSTSVRTTVPAAATTGIITIVGSSGTSTSGSPFTVAFPATNDNFATAQLINSLSGQASASTLIATKELGEPNHAGNQGGKSIWYRWTAPKSSTFTFETTGSSFDTLLAVYTGNSVSGLTLVTSNDDAGTATTSSATFSTSSGGEYLIAVDGYDGAGGTAVLTWAENATAPVVTSFSPQSGIVGTQVRIIGANLGTTTGVTFGGANASFTIDSGTQLTATVPLNAITGAIGITTSTGSTVTSGNFIVVGVPPNDDFASATSISGQSGRATLHNGGASKQPGEPDHAGNSGGKSVWYSWTAPATGTFTFDTSGSSFDTILAIYTGTALTNLTTVAANDDAGSLSTSSASFNATQSVNYRIAVDGYSGASGNMVLNWTRNSGGPVINSFSPSSGPVGTPVIVSGANFVGTQDVKFGGISALDYNVETSTRLSVTVPEGAVTGPITITTPVDSGTSAGQFTVTPGPANDDFIDRVILSGPSVVDSGSNIGASKESGEPAHAGNPGGRSVWWSWTAPANASFTISTQGSGFDTLLGVYTGDTLSSLTLVASNDDDPAGGHTSSVTINAIAGATYQIAVDGLNGGSGSVGLSIYPKGFRTSLYATGFEAAEGFTNGVSLVGQGGWQSTGSGGNTISSGQAGMAGQQASIGGKAPTTGDPGLTVWRQIDFVPTADQPLVKFAVAMSISASSNNHYDNFQWRLRNRAGEQLFTLNFDNNNRNISYQLEGGTPQATGRKFVNGAVHRLEVTMDLSRNLWNATLDGTALVSGKAVRTTAGPIDLGSMDAVWQLQEANLPGNNAMVFDDFAILPLQDSKPQIAFPPQSSAAIAGDPVSFVVVASGLAPLSYQWLKNGVAIAGATDSSYSIGSVALTDAGKYTVRVTNPLGKLTSPAATLIVGVRPTIVVPPTDIVSAAGRAISFKVTAAGTAPLTYQWFRNGTAIDKATKPALALTNVQPAQDGTYTVSITNSLGTVTTTPVNLTVGASFTAVRGTYNAVLTSGVNGTNDRGLFTFALTPTGSFTGSVSFAGQVFRLLGALDNSGYWTKVLGKDHNGQPVSISLQAGLFGPASVTGTLSVGGAQIPIGANLDPYNGTTNIAPQAGKYTLVLGTTGGLPAGHGYATVTVDKLGKVIVAGKLGDYTAFSSGTSIDASGVWPFFLSLYGGKGYLTGAVTFEPLANSDLDGTLHWSKPLTTTGIERAAFEGDIALSGSAYKYVAATPILPLDSSHNGTVAVTGGDVANAVGETVQISTLNRLTITKTTSTLTMTLTTASGLFSGTVKPNGATLALPYSGVVLQKTNNGAGVVKGSTATSLIDLEPATP